MARTTQVNPVRNFKNKVSDNALEDKISNGVKIKSDTIKMSSKTIKAILEELRLLRNEVSLLLPQEELEEYAHPDRIRRSYQKAIKKHPPISILYGNN